MNRSLKYIFSVALLLLSCTIFAQQPIIVGVVLDQENKPITGVSVMVEGTRSATITDNNGEFKIEAKEGAVLLFNFIGFTTERVTISNFNKLTVTLQEERLKLGEAVVTALGITRSEKSLGYALTKMSSEQINNTLPTYWLDGLAGKVAGLNFNQPSGPSGSTRVTLRGESSLSPDNSRTLFVVDGVPINSELYASGGTTSYSTGGVDNPIDYGDGINDINPEDMDNITILKGAAATALYGSKAAAGAIIITTKGGKADKGIGVTVGTSLNVQKASYWPDFQNEYGMGSPSSNKDVYSHYTFTDENGISYTTSSQNQAWGPRFEGQMFYQYGALQEDGTYVATPWVARDWYKGIYEEGVNMKNYIILEGNNGKDFSGRLSFSQTDNKWILPNTGDNTTNIMISATTKFSRFAKLTVKSTLNHKSSDNLPQLGLGRGTVPYLLLWGSPGIDINWYRDYKEWVKKYPNTARNNIFYANSDGPFFSLYENLNTLDRRRAYGVADLMIDITPKLSLQLRSSYDIFNDFRTQRKAYNSVNYLKGRYREQLLTSANLNNDFLFKYDESIGKFKLQGLFGGIISNMIRNNSSVVGTGMDIEGQYTITNSIAQPVPSLFRSNKQVNSLYGMFEANYNDYLFLSITGRNDWSSTLSEEYNSYFYPSVSLSAILSDIIKMPHQISLLKLRASWANVGNDTSPYVIHSSYGASSFPGGVLMPTSFSNPNIKPEMVESWEFGVDARFFKSRLNLDVTYYHSLSYNQIVNTPVDPSTGYQTIRFNAGKLMNSGWEVTLGAIPIRNKNLRWNSTIVFTKNNNKVIELAPGVDTWVVNSYSPAQIEARPGGPIYGIYGYGFERAPEGAYVTLSDGSTQSIAGEVLYDVVTGYPRLATSERVFLGNVLPKWKGGITNSILWRGLRFHISIDGSFGGKAYSYSHALLSYTGKLKNSLPGRYEGLIGDGYVYDANSDSYHRNTTVTQYIGGYYGAYYQSSSNTETNVFSTSFIKLREIRLEYNFPRKLIEKSKVLQGASIALFGTNLAMWTKWPINDPEVASLDGSTINVGLEAGSFPMTRSYGLNLRLRF
ncbi:MAG: SusC/RagA family TonB-linked outer membrane protein [Bacteroidales bacterium]